MAGFNWMQIAAGGGIVYLILAYMNKWPPFNEGGIGSELLGRLSKPADEMPEVPAPAAAINPFESTVPPGNFELGMGFQMPNPGAAGIQPATPGNMPAALPQNDPTAVNYGIYTQYLNGLRSEQQRARDELAQLTANQVGIGGDITTLPQPPVAPGMTGMGIPPMYGGPVVSGIPPGRYGSFPMMPPQQPPMMMQPPMFPRPFMPVVQSFGINIMVAPQKTQYMSGERVTVYATGLAPFEPATIRVVGMVEQRSGGISIGNWLSIGGRNGGTKQDIEKASAQSDPMGRINPTQIKLPDTSDGIVTLYVIGQSGKSGSIMLNVLPTKGQRGGISIGGSGGINIGGLFGRNNNYNYDVDFSSNNNSSSGDLGDRIRDMVSGMLGNFGINRSFYADTTFIESEAPTVPQDIDVINPTLIGTVSRNQPMGLMSNKLGNIR